MTTTPEQADRMAMMLEILSASGGQADASDHRWNWINAFCSEHEGREPDTFNLAHDMKLTSVSHDSNTDMSIVYLLDAGRDWLKAHRLAHSQPQHLVASGSRSLSGGGGDTAPSGSGLGQEEEIAQRHREAAARLYLELEEPPYSPKDLAEAEAHRRGDYDAHASVQAFARFEATLSSAGLERETGEPFAWVDNLEWHKPAHRAVMASVKLGSWMSAALEDPAVCEAMKADIREWFSAGEPMETLGQALTALQPLTEPQRLGKEGDHADRIARRMGAEFVPHDYDAQFSTPAQAEAEPEDHTDD